MNLRKHGWDELVKVLESNENLPPSYMWQWLRENYEATQAVAVRRQAEASTRVITLGRLVRELAEHADSVTRHDWVARFDADDPYWTAVAHKQWDDTFAGEDDPDRLDAALPQRDLEALTQASARVRKYVDRHLAHHDAKPVSSDELPALNEVHAAVVLIGNVYQRWHGLITASSLMTVTPMIQGHWRKVFEMPWAKPGHKWDSQEF
jgi:hypothetical protein